MRRTGFFLAATAALAMALAPGVAEARAGGGSSSGSRGSKTYSAPPSTQTAPTTAQPMQRTQTAPNAAAPSAGMAGAAAPSRGGSFMAGMAGGLLGVGLAGMLFGGGFFGAGLGGAGFLGLLLQIALIGGLGYLAFRLIRGRMQPQPAMAGGPNAMGRDMMDNGNNRMMGGSAAGMGMGQGQSLPPIAIQAEDYQQFEKILQGVQAAWTGRDVNAMRAIVTPEMLGYFGEQLSEHDRRGVRNQVTQVRLLSGDLAEAWAEGDREYATVAMKFGMIDVTVDASGKVVDGSPDQPTTATEVWTFLRVRGGPWVVSAIQQTS